jgi:hypothetical protein
MSLLFFISCQLYTPEPIVGQHYSILDLISPTTLAPLMWPSTIMEQLNNAMQLAYI